MPLYKTEREIRNNMWNGKRKKKKENERKKFEISVRLPGRKVWKITMLTG